MRGLDISHHQGVINWSIVPMEYEFAFMKCTEGLTFRDTYFQSNKDRARKAGKLCGFYHFANLNDPVKEADFFLKNVGDILPGELVALDAETGQTPEWCVKFLNQCFLKLGFRPLIYCPAGNGMDWSPVVKLNYGLWVARYGMNTGFLSTLFPPKLGAWPFYAIWQYTSRGTVQGIAGNVDLNYTKMSLDVLRKYGKPVVEVCQHCKLHNCPK